MHTYKSLTVEERQAQLDQFRHNLEAQLFPLEIDLALNEGAPEEDVAHLRERYNKTVSAIGRIERMKGDLIVERSGHHG